MNIKQVEETTGITKQNIRFYEKQGLLNPVRNEKNEYREYQEKDIQNLKLIKILRKLGMPIVDIKRVLERRIPLADAVRIQKSRLEREKADLEAAIRCCEKISADTIDTLSVEESLRYMEEEEKKGGHFVKIWNDFLQIAAQEEEKHFSFMPDTMIDNPREFTEELLKYADENGLNMVITKESMYPEFTIDGVAYEAERTFSRFGAVIHCSRKKDIIEENENQEEKQESVYHRILRWIYKLLPILFLFLYFLFSMLLQGGNPLENIGLAILLTITLGSVLLFIYPRTK